MCYSATASFVTGSVLVPTSVFTIRTALLHDRRFLGFAAFPLFFGIQQMIEGGLWLAIAGNEPEQMHWLAVSFLFFALLFWLAYVPISAFLVERNEKKRTLFLSLATLGVLLGLSLFVPILLSTKPLSVEVQIHSISYNSGLIWDGLVPANLLRGVYAAIICVPLLLSSENSVKAFGVLITASLIVGMVVAQHAFTSIWCFMAAILSGYVLFMTRSAASYGAVTTSSARSTHQ